VILVLDMADGIGPVGLPVQGHPQMAPFTPRSSMLNSPACLLPRLSSHFGKFLQQIGLALLLCIAAGISTRAQVNEFGASGNLITHPRSQHTATLLNNGNVLIAGGVTLSATTPATSVSLASAELYDATTLAFAATGNMTVARYAHTATLLSNGKVLIAGGVDANGTAEASAELYDPSSGAFTATGSMTVARSAHTAALLSNGKVLISGGVDSSGNTEGTAELYDPASGIFAATGGMTTPRYSHTATVLGNGKVLIAGGENSVSTQLASAEVYDPSTGVFTATGNMTNPRYSHTATLLNTGKVLVAGGWGVSTMGACQESPVWDTAELYDPAAGTFTPTGSMFAHRYLHTATTLSNNLVLLAAGDMGPTFNPDCGIEYPPTLSEADLYDPVAGTFTQTASLISPLESHTATLLNDGTVLIAGGTFFFDGNPAPSAELFEAAFATWGPPFVTFASQAVGTPSGIGYPVTILNSQGSSALNITQVAINGTNPSDFTQTNNCLGSVAVGATCSINVMFTPGALGIRTGNVVVVNNNNSSDAIRVPLSGTGTPATAPTATVMVSPTTLSFASQYVGTSGLPQTVTVSNIGNAPVGIAAVDSSSPDFGVLNNCVNPLPVGGNCTVGVFFDPTAGGPRTGTLTFNDNSPTGFQTVSLSGTGQDFSMAASSSGGSSATVSAGQTATYSLAVAPGGGFAQSVNLSCSGGPTMSTCSVSPSSVALNGTASKTATVTVATSSQGLSPTPFDSGGNVRQQLPHILIQVMALFLFLMWVALRQRRWRFSPALALAALLCLAMSLSSCGGGSTGSSSANSASQSGTYTITVTGNFVTGSANLKHTAKFTLVVQ
jgi:Kelch motif